MDYKEMFQELEVNSDAELVEACSYEISALKARYSYLLRQIKEGGTSAAPVAYMAAAAMKGGRSCQS